MRFFKVTNLALCLFFSASALKAQNVTINKGGTTKWQYVKNSDDFIIGTKTNNYFITKSPKTGGVNYYLEGYNTSGDPIAQTFLDINPGVINNMYLINQLIGLGNSAFALIEHQDKAGGKNTLLARSLDNSGKVTSNEVELMNLSIEKISNAGSYRSAVSPDNNLLAVVAEFPFVKEQPARFKIAIFDKDLKRQSETEVVLPGEIKKNRTINVVTANDGTVYLIQQALTKSGDMTLNVFQHSASGGAGLKEYTFEMASPMQFYNYSYTLNSNSELVITGLYYERKTISSGEKAVGVFYFNNKGKSEKVFKSFALDKPVEYLRTRKVLISGSTIFLTAEQYREERITPSGATAGSVASLNYSYNYTHKDEYVIGLDNEGNKKFELSVAKDFKVVDRHKQYYSGYYICNEKLTIVYNDHAEKYTKDKRYSLIPVLVQVTKDGLMLPPVIFKDNLKLPYDYILYPNVSVQNSSNEISFLLRGIDFSQYLNIKVD